MIKRNRFRCVLSTSMLAVGACCVVVPAVLHASSVAGTEIDTELDLLLTRTARDLTGRIKLLEGQVRSSRASASVDLARGVITVRLDRAFLPRDYGPAFEDQRSLIDNALLTVTEPYLHVSQVKYLYGGFDIYHYFPEVKQEDDKAREAGERIRREKQERQRIGIVTGSGVAFVAAGHGYYLDHKDRVWKTQREEHNGIMEGMLTPSYAAELKSALESRSQMPVYRPRVQGGAEAHPESGREWWRMAARYAVAAQYPGHPDIWNTHAGSAAHDREYKEDINSRPLLANHLGAEVAIHMHSNADDTGAARGARVIVQPGRSVDAALGASVLCAMKELIRSAAGYGDFIVASAPHAADKGENRLAAMPSIIVETAFHTHPEDAAALLDPVFRAASMKGVEKGYRLFRDGKDCTPLALSKIDRVTVPANGAAETNVRFDGHPQFPITLSFTPVYCTQPGACRAEEKTVAEASASPIKVQMSCEGSGYGMVNWSTVMRDADGVTSGPVEHWMTCQGGG